MSSISDPARPSRRDRRRAQKLIDTAFAEQRLTAADRTLRTQRIDAAHTRGDLAMITRDLVAPTSVALGKALDPTALSSMRVNSPAKSSLSVPGLRSSLPAGTTIDLSGIQHKVRMAVLIAIVSFVAICGLGLAAFVPVFVGGWNEVIEPAPGPTAVPTAMATDRPSPMESGGPSDGPPGSVSNLHTAAGWRAFVDAIKSASGSTSIYDAVVYPGYASVGLDGDGAAERRFYRDGRWQDSVSVRTPAVGSLVDVAQIDPQLIARLPSETARHFNIDDPTGSYLIINAMFGEPRIMVYVQTAGQGSQYRSYDFDGQPLS